LPVFQDPSVLAEAISDFASEGGESEEPERVRPVSLALPPLSERR
jgi:hypothetical protein